MLTNFLPALLSVACTGGTPSDTAPSELYLAPPAEGDGIQFHAAVDVPAHTEVWKCVVYPLPSNGEWQNVNSVEYVQTDGMHHMTLSAPGFIPGVIEPGTYDCEDLLAQMMEEQVMFFGNQGGSDTLTLPEGVVASLPPALDVIQELHVVNTTAEDIVAHSYVNAYTIPQSEVVEGIWGGQVRDETIALPAGEETTEWTRCVMNEDVELIFIGSHTHALGTKFSVATFDGTSTGEVFYENEDWQNPLITQYDPPLVVPAGTGFEYACTWHNTTQGEVNYGLTASDEMCNLTLVHTPASTSARCEVVETSDGVLWSDDD